MNFLISSMKKDIARWRQDYVSILIWISIPLLIGGLITSMMGSGGAQPKGVLLIADQDDSLISGLVAGAYSQGELGELISVEKVSLGEGQDRINAGDASGLLIIPEGFAEAFFESTPVTLELKTNPSQTILPGIITDVTEILLDAGFYLQHVFGPEIKLISEATGNDNIPGELFVATISVAIQKKIEAATPHLFPPIIELEVSQPPKAQAGIPIALLYVPGIILMAIMFAANGLAGDYWEERQQGTLRRLVVAPGQLTGFVAGKALAAAIVIAVIGGVTLVIGFLYHGIAWSRLPSSLVWVTVSGVALFAWFGALQMLFSNQRTASVLSSVILFPLLMAGGSFFPFEALPGWIASIGRKTPNGFMADRLGTEITGASAWVIDPQSWIIASVMALSGLLICAWRLRNGFSRA